MIGTMHWISVKDEKPDVAIEGSRLCLIHILPVKLTESPNAVIELAYSTSDELNGVYWVNDKRTFRVSDLDSVTHWCYVTLPDKIFTTLCLIDGLEKYYKHFFLKEEGTT